MITSKTISNGILRALATILIIGIVLYFLYEIQTVIVYLCISLILCLIANPMVLFLKNKLKFSNSMAASTTIIFFIFLIVGFILLFVPLIISQANNLALLDTAHLQSQFIETENSLEKYFNIPHIDLNKVIKDSKLISFLDFSYFTGFINTIINFMADMGMGLVSVFFITFFFIKDQDIFKDQARRILPDSNEDKILNSIAKINHLLTRYFIGLLLQLIVVFILYLIVLLIFGNKNAFVIAFLCAILNIIPYLGPIIGTTLAGILTMISMIGKDFQSEILPTTIYVIIGFLLVQAIDNNISQPIISSKSVNSHPLEIFLVILISGITFGIVGMIIAIPAFTMIKVILKEFFPNNKIVSVLTERI
ncbi:MAG: AI-2E family transporter [Flavobacterium nitrogenifigens]|uniref:Predicted PurR-regulated permease PerM n=1 Tax=Flavobacterium nitrogenifigens TaxID=1617283 RepID=A0A521DV31_9FLAO|nr:AI-2E family transporter [Flavobacterium nitrogenifigens]KAF2327617.1 AI-2E family transporter [Flavobacterium nitrogenifigens]MDQ8014609.1 AI-2E family transporter [Flavobacterium nitrogenifigens]SMO75593.1 Predicted PurR-regulated permease PerM [Flavobacterium nitrogenifigens]